MPTISVGYSFGLDADPDRGISSFLFSDFNLFMSYYLPGTLIFQHLNCMNVGKRNFQKLGIRIPCKELLVRIRNVNADLETGGINADPEHFLYE